MIEYLIYINFKDLTKSPQVPICSTYNNALPDIMKLRNENTSVRPKFEISKVYDIKDAKIKES